MSDLVKISDQASVCPPDLAQMTRKELLDALQGSLRRTAVELVRLAWIVRILEERGEDLTDLKLDLVPYLRLIAYGQLLPEVVVKYGHSPALIRVARSLPLPDQQKLAAGEMVPLVVRRDDGSFDQRLADPSLLSQQQITQAFAAGRIRPIQEQILMLEARGKPAAKPIPKTGRCRPDKARKGIVVGRAFVPLPEVLEALADLRDEPDGGDEDEEAYSKVIMIRLTPTEHENLNVSAARGRTKMNRLIRRALMAAGLI